MAIDSVVYTFPVPKLADGKNLATNSATGTSTIGNIYEKYLSLFGDEDNNSYGKALEVVLDNLNTTLGKIKDNLGNKYIDTANLETTFINLKTDRFYTAAQTIEWKDDETTYSKRIDSNCREGFLAYRHYLKTIASSLDRIYEALKDGRAALASLANTTDPEDAHILITQLEINEKLIYKEFQDLRTHYRYNADTKQWDEIVDENFVSQLKDVDELQALRDTKIAYKDSTSTGTSDPTSKLTVFNSLTLLDRLRYIRWYYELILRAGKTDYSVFPDNVDTGYPCLPDVKSTEATKDTKSLGAMEVFYVGYLIDRDGPINAVSSFFEVKTAALSNNLALQSKKIQALNVYLGFINRALDVLNESQSKGPKRLPDGVVVALTYLCGQKMYNLFEGNDGYKYLVVPCVNSGNKDENKDENKKDKYMLIRADEEGMNILVGDMGSANGGRGNSIPTGLALTGGLWNIIGEGSVHVIREDVVYVEGPSEVVAYAEGEKNPKGIKFGKYDVYDSSEQKFYLPIPTSDESDESDASGAIADVFKLPTQLEVNTIIPGSVKDYEHLDPIYEKDTDTPKKVNEQAHAAKIESWTNAFSNKTQYINTAIDTINTDVSVDRSKIDTLNSLTSTFRTRAQDVYSNIVANIRG